MLFLVLTLLAISFGFVHSAPEITQTPLWLVCLVGLLLYYNYSRRNFYWISWQLPGPNPALPLLGNLLMLCSNIHNVIPLIDTKVSEYMDGTGCGIMRFWLGPVLMLITNEPSVAYQINQKTQQKSTEYQYLAKPFMKKALFLTNEEPHWRQSQKPFHLGLSTENLKSFIPKFHEECLSLANTFREFSTADKSIFPVHILSKFALTCIVKCALDFDIRTKDEKANEDYRESFESLMETFQLRIVFPVLRIDFIHRLVGLESREAEHIKTLVSYQKSILDYHRKNKPRDKINKKTGENSSFIEHLMKEESRIPDDEILANMTSIVVAGTDTLVTEYTMLLILLAQNPLVQQKVYQEVIQVLGDDLHVCPSAEDLNKLEYLDRVLKECLRMFPAAPYIGRTVSEDITITGTDNKEYVIPKGVTIMLLIRNIQNNPLYYENPNKFDPDRWLPENVAKRPSGCYLPFNNGHRKCVGGRYALLQMKTMAATILRAYEILVSESCAKFEDINVVMNMTVKIGDNCQVRLRERRRNNKHIYLPVNQINGTPNYSGA